MLAPLGTRGAAHGSRCPFSVTGHRISAYRELLLEKTGDNREHVSFLILGKAAMQPNGVERWPRSTES